MVYTIYIPGGAMVKNLPVYAVDTEDWTWGRFNPWGWGDLLGQKMATYSTTLAWKIHSRLSEWLSEWAHTHTCVCVYAYISMFLYLYIYSCMGVCRLLSQSCPTLCNPMGCSPPGSFVHEILQTRKLEWVAILFSMRSPQSRHQTWVFCIAGRFFTNWATEEAHICEHSQHSYTFSYL